MDLRENIEREIECLPSRERGPARSKEERRIAQWVQDMKHAKQIRRDTPVYELGGKVWFSGAELELAPNLYSKAASSKTRARMVKREPRQRSLCIII